MPIIINTAKKPEPHDENRNHGGASPEPGDRPEGAKWLTWVIDITIIVVALVLALLVRYHLYDIAVVTSRSMEPALTVGDRLVFDHRRSLHGAWKRGDVVFFDPPETWATDDPSVLVKRIIGLPGETVEVRQGHVLVNGNEIKTGALEDPDDYVPAIKLAPNEYFVLGDNRSNSADSRRYGPVPRDDIRGRATLRLWPRPGRLPAWQP